MRPTVDDTEQQLQEYFSELEEQERIAWELYDLRFWLEIEEDMEYYPEPDWSIANYNPCSNSIHQPHGGVIHWGLLDHPRGPQPPRVSRSIGTEATTNQGDNVTIDTSKLNSYEVQALVNFFMYTMEYPQRYRLQQEFPCIYNKLHGDVILKTTVVAEE